MDPFGDDAPEVNGDVAAADADGLPSAAEMEAAEADMAAAEVEAVVAETSSPAADEPELATAAEMAAMRISASPSAASLQSLSTPKPEPETIRAWREEQEKMLALKDEQETSMRDELREQAKKELAEWYKKYEDQLGKTKESNRQSEKTFVAEVNDIAPGTEWERIHKLCDFNTKNARNVKDLSRMRSVLLQLKQNPRPVSAGGD